MKLLFSLFTSLVLIFLSLSSWGLQTHRTGNSRDVKKKTSFQICMAGGGSDDLWRDGWRRFLQKSGGGDVVIIRSDNTFGKYESWIYEDTGRNDFPKVNSVTTLLLEAASDTNHPEVVKNLRNAELIFFAGGDQDKYIDFFKGSKAEIAINHALKDRHIPIGGTSAGMAILAGIDYTGRYNSPRSPDSFVTSEDVLKNPSGSFIDLDRRFLVPPFMKNVVTETHLSERNRQGRLMGLMQKAESLLPLTHRKSKVKGIGGDEGTAFCYNRKGKGAVFGKGQMVFVKANSQEKVIAYTIAGNSKGAFFDLKKWRGEGGSKSQWSIDLTEPETPRLISDRP